MTRLIAALLALTIGIPNLAWGASTYMGEVQLVGASCCDEMSKEADKDAEREEARLERACCCKPSPVPLQLDSLQYLVPDLCVDRPMAGPVLSLLQPDLALASVRRLRVSASPRAPPPSRSLLAQHIALLL